MRKNVHFEPSARLQSILSRELVADPNVAVLEFVKNGYDAGASRVVVDLDLGDRAQDGVLIVADDGEGMDLDAFQRNWMRPGFSEKAVPDFRRRHNRVPAGEKGLGRLAAGRLGEVLDVYTRRNRSQKWLHARFVWAAFDDMEKTLSAINIPVDDESEPPLTVGDSGTVIRITELSLNWDAKVPGRKSASRHPTRIGRLRQDLEMLLLPLTAGGDRFEIWLNHNSTQPEDEKPGKIEPPTLELITYRYDFEIKRRGRGWQVKRSIHRGPELLADELSEGLKARESRTAPLPSKGDGAGLNDVGPFSGSFFYAPDSADHLRKIRAPVGVLLYRDGIRVEPYGQAGNDWLGAQAKKASRQGYAAIQPAALYGAVHITREDNPDLRSQANREGLIEDEAVDTFIEACRNEFATFERIVFDEYLEPRWRSPEDRRRSSAEATQGYALSLARTLMHAVNQPVATANTVLDRLQTLITRQVTDDEIRRRLQELHDQTAAQLTQIGEAVHRVLDMVDFDPTPESFDIGELARELVEHRRTVNADPGVHVEVESDGDLTVELPRAPVYEALKELLTNASTAPRANGTRPQVRIRASESAKTDVIHITVTDNGIGIDPAVRKDLFRRAASTKGGIGMGLILVRQLLHLINGDVEIVDGNGSGAGATFAITVPRTTE